MTTVKIDIELIGTAITALEDLSSSIDSQRHIATSSTPISLPSLQDGTLGKTSRWLDDHLEDLTTRRDLATLLDKEGTGSASYTVASDTLRNAQQLLGTELAKVVGDLDWESDEDDYERISALLARWQEEPVVMSQMFTDLGPDGTVAALSNIALAINSSGLEAEKLRDVAERIRTGLSTASHDPGFPAEQYGHDLVRYSVSLLSQDEQDAFAKEFGIYADANVLTFLMEDTTYSADLLLGAARELDHFERDFPDRLQPADVWYSQFGGGPLAEGRDPMAQIMHNLGENPEAGLTFFTEDADRKKYYFNDRSWEADGYGGISHAVEGIGTHAGNLEKDPQATTQLVSQFLDEVADSPGFNAEDAKAASPHIASLLKFYMPAVDNALREGLHEGDGRSTFLSVEHFGDFEHYPQLYKNDLDALMQVAMGTQEGTQRVAEGVAAYQQTRVNNIAAELALDPSNIDLRNELTGILQGRAALQGFAEYSVGRVEIDGAASRDAQRQAFLDAVSGAASLVPLPGADLVGEAGSKLIGYGFSQGVSLTSGEISDSWTNEAASVADDASVRADESLRQVKIDTFYSLIDAGIISKDEIPNQWLDDRGRLIDRADIPREDLPSYTESAMNAVNNYASDDDLRGPYRDQFMEYYDEASK